MKNIICAHSFCSYFFIVPKGPGENKFGRLFQGYGTTEGVVVLGWINREQVPQHKKVNLTALHRLHPTRKIRDPLDQNHRRRRPTWLSRQCIHTHSFNGNNKNQLEQCDLNAQRPILHWGYFQHVSVFDTWRCRVRPISYPPYLAQHHWPLQVTNAYQ